MANFIGLEIKISDRISISPGQERLSSYSQALDSILISKFAKINTLESLVGKLQFCASTAPLLRSSLSPIYAMTANAAKLNFKSTKVGGDLHHCLTFWRELTLSETAFNLIIEPLIGSSLNASYVSASDASTTKIAAWACSVNDFHSFSWASFSVDDLAMEIPWIRNCTRLCGDVSGFELIGVALGALLCQRMGVTPFLSVSDSSNAVNAVSKQSSKSKVLGNILANCKHLTLLNLVHLSGHNNWVADRLTRDDGFSPPGRSQLSLSQFIEFISDR